MQGTIDISPASEGPAQDELQDSNLLGRRESYEVSQHHGLFDVLHAPDTTSPEELSKRRCGDTGTSYTYLLVLFKTSPDPLTRFTFCTPHRTLLSPFRELGRTFRGSVEEVIGRYSVVVGFEICAGCT